MDHLTLSGHSDAFPLTKDAKSLLLTYLRDARAATADTPEDDEMIREIETDIGDRFRTLLDGGAQQIDRTAVAAILEEIGPLETDPPDLPRRIPWLFRVDEGRWFGGLCLGLATKFDLDSDWLRTFAFFFLLLSGGALGLVYLVALFLAPRIASVDAYQALLARTRRPRPW